MFFLVKLRGTMGRSRRGSKCRVLEACLLCIMLAVLVDDSNSLRIPRRLCGCLLKGPGWIAYDGLPTPRGVLDLFTCVSTRWFT